jgi:predicted nucleic acid-binding protein
LKDEVPEVALLAYSLLQENVEPELRVVESDDTLLVEIPFDRNIALTLRQVDRSQIPDLPDRIIAATGLYLNVPVISRDRRIQLSTIATIW